MFKFLLKIFPAIMLAVTFSIYVEAETHTISFINKCGFGIPTLVVGPNVVSTGQPFVSNGPILSAIAFLQTGNCGFDGEGCTVIDITLENPTSPGSGSICDISLIPPHVFSVTSGFEYTNGCVGLGADCTSASCPSAIKSPGQTTPQVECQTDNVNLTITFCD